MKITDIVWDIDLEDDQNYGNLIQQLDLPTEMEIPNYVDDIEDYLSDETGYLVESFNIDNAKVKISFEAEIDPEFIDEFKRIVDHHLDNMIDMTEFPEIFAVYNAKLEVIK